MIRIKEELWINGDHVESAFVKEGVLNLATVTMLGEEDYPYTVDREYLEDACSAMQLPFNVILGIMKRQENDADAGGGDTPAEE